MLKYFVVLFSSFLMGLSLFWHPIFFPNSQAFQVFIFIIVLDILWVSQALPMGITALLPLLFFPYIGVFSLNDVVSNYISKISFVILASSAIGIAFAKYNLHKATLAYFFSKFQQNLNGFLYTVILASCFISMFISNTVTGIIMLPLVYTLVNGFGEDKGIIKSLKIRSILAVCFASSIGGVGTIFGSPVNFLGLALLEKYFEINIDFLTWSYFAMPVVFVLTLLLALLLRFSNKTLSSNVVNLNLKSVQNNLSYKINTREKFVILIISVALLLSLFSSYIQKLIGVKIDYFYILLIAKILLFTFPLSKPLLNFKEDTKYFPWQVVFVIGASFSFAGAIVNSGLQALIEENLQLIAGNFSMAVILILLIALLLFFTEISSASGALVLFFPVVAFIPNIQNIVDIKYFTIIMVMASSLAFMLPISTIPNLLASSSYIKPKHLLKHGFVLNICSLLVLSALVLFVLK